MAAFKVGNLALYQHGWSLISELKQRVGIPVIADLKLMEVPFMAENIARSAHAAEADGIMICGASGLDTLGFCRAAFPGLLFIVTQFTHCRDVISDHDADSIVEAALKLGCDGVQVPGTFPDRISAVRERVRTKLKIVACGIGRQGPTVGSAIQHGADYEIVGRAIYDVETPQAASLIAQKLSNEVNGLA